jgi:CBS-domain-containing membrane protein
VTVDVRASRRTLGLYLLVSSAMTAALLAGLAHVSREPFIFPSIGPTIFILFFAPLSVQAAPRNTIGGQAIGILCGYLALVTFGLQDAPADIFDLSTPRIGAAIMALSLTLGLMVWTGLLHGPAGVTTLIVALGLVHTIPHLLILIGAVVLAVLCAGVINRIAGIPYPLWMPPPAAEPEPSTPAPST